MKSYLKKILEVKLKWSSGIHLSGLQAGVYKDESQSRCNIGKT
jgi:hypothetical protein